jgi:hypothetical protein
MGHLTTARTIHHTLCWFALWHGSPYNCTHNSTHSVSVRSMTWVTLQLHAQFNTLCVGSLCDMGHLTTACTIQHTLCRFALGHGSPYNCTHNSTHTVSVRSKTWVTLQLHTQFNTLCVGSLYDMGPYTVAHTIQHTLCRFALRHGSPYNCTRN